jgi:hypothetical protein
MFNLSLLSPRRPHLRGLILARSVRLAQKITFAEMRDSGVRGFLVYCADYHCSRSIAPGGDRLLDHVWLSDLEPCFVCQACDPPRSPTSGWIGKEPPF